MIFENLLSALSFKLSVLESWSLRRWGHPSLLSISLVESAQHELLRADG